MRETRLFQFAAVLAILFPAGFLRAQPLLGDAPLAPKDVSGLPGGGIRPAITTGSFNVNTSSREEVREFYNAVYTSSDGVPITSTAVTADCFAGTNSPTFASVTLRRINWFRAMAGLPAAVTFDAAEGAKDQQGALMMSANDQLQHVGIPPTWSCFSTDGTNAAANSNLALGNDGPDAITAYILDNGANNYEVGHRRWILYPQTQVMGTGDVPPESGYNSANATWVFDANFYGPRPATRTPYVSWPPAGYAPAQVVFPQWSFALSNAALSAATVTLSSNGVPVPVALQNYITGYGENTLVWYETNQSPATDTAFPFNGTDTVYSVTVSNVVTSAGTKNFSYTVTVFDPATTGADYFPLVISGTNQPSANAANSYTCTPATNPNTTGYQWLVAQLIAGGFVENAAADLTSGALSNFTLLSPADYPVITNAYVDSTPCIRLLHNENNTVPQIFQCNRVLFPATNTTLSFKSQIGFAFTNELARVQVSANGGLTWNDLYSDAGCNPPGTSSYTFCENAFTTHTLSLSNYAGQRVLLRFDYDFLPPYYYFLGTATYLGWSLENIVVSNAQQFVSAVTNATASTNFTFTPTQTGNYVLQARGVIFTEFPIDWGTVKQVTAVAGAPFIVLNTPVVSSSQVQLPFRVAGLASTFKLLQADQISGAWTTNTGAVLTTNVAGSSYTFTVTHGSNMRFYRIQSP